MVDHTAVESHDPTMAILGHASHLVRVIETKTVGLHCCGHLDDCGWYGGSFKDRASSEKLMRAAWQRHVDFVQAGGVLRHGRAANVDEGICHCVSCSIPWRMAQAATAPSAAADPAGGRRT